MLAYAEAISRSAECYASATAPLQIQVLRSVLADRCQRRPDAEADIAVVESDDGKIIWDSHVKLMRARASPRPRRPADPRNKSRWEGAADSSSRFSDALPPDRSGAEFYDKLRIDRQSGRLQRVAISVEPIVVIVIRECGS